VAAAIRDGGGKVLLQERLPGKHHAGLWEFPGGKVEVSENPRSALCREVEEELGLRLFVADMTPAGFAENQPDEGGAVIVLFLYECPGWDGEPEGLEGQNWGWFTWAEAAALALAPMDRTLLERLGSTGDCQAENTPLCAAPQVRP
jgi:8-oxo-dGTP diphosphatase